MPVPWDTGHFLSVDAYNSFEANIIIRRSSLGEPLEQKQMVG